MSELMTELEEQARASLKHLLERVNIREDIDLLTKDEIIDTILMSKPEVKVSDLIDTLTKKANDIREEQKKLEGSVETMAMEGPNQFKTVYYRPTCKFGWDDCIHDPAYIYATYPEWYKELYGDKSPEDAALDDEEGCCRSCSEKCCYYDDEDK
jgi:hypothetical protein